MNLRRWLMLALGAAAVLLILGRAVAGMYSDYLWYDALGAGALWRLRMNAMVTLKVGSAIAAGLFAFLNLYAVRQSVVQLVFPRRLGNLEISEEVSGKYLLGASIALSAVLGMLLALPHTDWTSFVLARNGRLFGQRDPYIQADLGFFVYWLPFENTLWTWALLCVLVVTVTVILLYALTPSLKLRRGSIEATAYVRRHFTILAGVVLLMLAWSFRLDMYSLLMEGTGPEGGFGFIDHHYGIPGNLLLSILCLGAGLIVMWAGSVGQFRLAAISILGIVVVSLAAREVVPAVARHAGTDADRAAREQGYPATRAGYTRRAFGVDLVQRADSMMAFPSVAAALPWVPVWDPPALRHAVDASRAAIDQRVRIGWHAASEGLVADVLHPAPAGSADATPWTITRVDAASADERGGPLPAPGAAAVANEETPIEAPLVYPGASAFTVISDSLNHTAGVPLRTWISRAASAWTLQNIGILSSNEERARPTLISRRDIRDRVGVLMPFFAQGRDVAPLVIGDSVYWALDLYSASSTYPLSRHAVLAGEERSYFRHAAVAIVQGSTGDISVVPDTVLDPIAQTWVRRLPSIFGTWTALPSGIRALIPPPIDGLYAQAYAFGRFGASSDSAAPWRLPTLDGADTNLVGDNLPIVLPDEKFTAVALPIVDDSDRVRGLLIGAGGANHATMWDSLHVPGPRWSVVLERLRSLDSLGVTSRDGAGTGAAELAHGRVRSIPVRSGIAFMQPTYRWRSQAIPALDHVTVLAGDTVRSFAPHPLAPPASTNPPAGPAQSPAALYEAMRSALRRGDWAAFGRAFDALGRALERQKVP